MSKQTKLIFINIVVAPRFIASHVMLVVVAHYMFLPYYHSFNIARVSFSLSFFLLFAPFFQFLAEA